MNRTKTKGTKRRIFFGKMILCIILMLCMVMMGCSGEENSWQEQYDLGMRYLSEGNYEEAIIAFTAAIEIDPKRADTYLGLAEAYAGAGDMDRAMAILQRGIDETNDSALIGALALYQVQAETKDDRFTNNIFYVPQEELNSAHQTVFKNAISAFRSKDTQSLLAMMESTELIESATKAEEMYGENIHGFGDAANLGTIRVWIDGVKMKIDVNPIYPGGIGVGIEMREENGSAFYCRVEEGDQAVNKTICWGTTADWNWNGSFEAISDSADQIGRTTGDAVNGVYHGEVHYQFGDPDGSRTDNEQVMYYENGRYKAIGPADEYGNIPVGNDLTHGGYVYISAMNAGLIHTPAGWGTAEDDPNSSLHSHLW